MTTLFFSWNYALFARKYGGWGYLAPAKERLDAASIARWNIATSLPALLPQANGYNICP
jgi:hypothetical protein